MRRLLIIGLLMALMPAVLQAQLCEVENTAFKAGEYVDYDLYFDWGIIWKKVGRASLSTEKTIYNSQPAYDIRLMAIGSKEADMLMKLRDTLQVYMTERLEPIYYKKAAEEGSYYSVDEAWYSHEDGVPGSSCIVIQPNYRTMDDGITMQEDPGASLLLPITTDCGAVPPERIT